MKFAIIAIVGAAQAVRWVDPFPPLDNPTPWNKDSLAACPEDEARNLLDDGYTQKVKWPYVGSTCALQISEDVTLVMLGGDEKPAKKDAAPAAAAPAAPAVEESLPAGYPNIASSGGYLIKSGSI